MDMKNDTVTNTTPSMLDLNWLHAHPGALLTVEEVARLLRRRPGGVRASARRGTLPSRIAGRRRLFVAAEILQLIGDEVK